MKKQHMKRKNTKKIVILVAIVLGTIWVLGRPGEDPATTTAAAGDECGGATDATGILGKLTDLAPDRLVESVTGTVACLQGGGSGMRAFVQFDGSTYTLAGQPVMDPSVQGEDARFVSYGSTSVKVELMHQGEPVKTWDMSRGDAGLLVVEFRDRPGNMELRISDSAAGQQTVVLG